ncbi:hypothetical protein [Zhongshania sp.]|uniref:hypothetical protein n=1 Tax=Zhongshania sp. TaxID=1971902 RepID=UPI00356ADD1B
MLLRLPARLRLAIRRTNSARERSETRFRDAIDAQPDGFVVYDADDRRALSNEKMRELYQASRHALQSELGFEQQQYASTANDSARQLLSILNGLLDISKMEAGKLELDREPFI